MFLRFSSSKQTLTLMRLMIQDTFIDAWHPACYPEHETSQHLIPSRSIHGRGRLGDSYDTYGIGASDPALRRRLISDGAAADLRRGTGGRHVAQRDAPHDRHPARRD